MYSLLDEAKAEYKRRRNQASNYTKRPEVREAIFSRDGYRCVLCGATDGLTVDHVISVYRGGTDDHSNLQTLCNRCNAGKTP